MQIAKIKVEVSIYQLRMVIKQLESLKYGMTNQTRETKVARSVLQPISKKLLKKQIDKEFAKKKFNLSFEYYEAHFLETVLLVINNIEYSNEVQNFINALNQKLA